MANSKIIITFIEDLIVGNYVKFFVTAPGSPQLEAGETWNYQRVQSYQVALGFLSETPGERSAINYMQSFMLDFPATIYSISRVSNVVTIEILNSPLTFVSGESDSDVSFEIINSSTPAFDFTNVSFLAGPNACAELQVNVSTTILATEIISPIQAMNLNNPFQFVWERGQAFLLKVKNAEGIEIERNVILPGLLSNNIGLQINPSPNGATVIVNFTYDNQLVVQYSLDNINFQESNVFSGLASGNYAIYVRDQFGCTKSRSFVVSNIGINSPFFHISKSMSLRFAQRIEWGDSGNYKTDENTLSFESDVKYPYCEVQQFQSSDVVRTQFKSNYSERIAKVLKSDGTEDIIPIEQLTNNLGLKDRRDARKFNMGNGRTGIYFNTGNMYNYDTGIMTGVYTLNGDLPEWAVEGNYVGLVPFAGGPLQWHEIQEIIYDESRNADVIVINTVISSLGSIVNVRSQYNRFNYDIFEFSIDMVEYLGQKIQVELQNNDPNFTDLKHLSEKVDVKVRQEETYEIRYKNRTNTDVVYATGIENLIRIPFTKKNSMLDEESENYKTDTSTKLMKAELYEGDEFVFEPVTLEIWRKICQALSHDTVFIDGVGYSKNGEFETEGPLDDTNLFILKAKMLKNGNVYSSLGNNDGGYGSSALEIPGLIETGTNGFLRY